MLRPLSELITPIVRKALTSQTDNQAIMRRIATDANQRVDSKWAWPTTTNEKDISK